MSNTFQVDLRGIVDLLSHHLYASPRVYVRELLQNAVDAITARQQDPERQEEPGRISIESSTVTGDGSLRIADNGIGLAAEDLPRIFDMFTQVSPRSERAHSGLGIGLALSRALIELHGGAIEARSEGPGKGSEFTVRLPLAPAV